MLYTIEKIGVKGRCFKQRDWIELGLILENKCGCSGENEPYGGETGL